MIIWLASYPRSGNTFIRTILNHAFGVKTYSIHGDKFDIAADEATREIVGHKQLPENFDYLEARQSSEPYFIKTHEIYGNGYENDKAIYVLRDGREATVSYYHYFNDFSPKRFSFLEIINGHTFFGSWGEHYFSWLKENKDSILILRYEEIIDSPQSAINKIAEFTCLKPKNNGVPVFADLHNINPQFFRSGKKDSFIVDLLDYEQKYFWLLNGCAMRNAGYIDHIPEFNDRIELEELFLKHVDLTRQRESKISAEMSQQFRNKEQIIQNKDIQLQKKDQQLKSKDEQLKSKDEQLKSKDEQLKSKDEQLNQKDQQMQEIRNSYSFRIGKKIVFPLSFLKKIFLK